MVLKYNLTGENRKLLVGAACKELNAPTKYLGAPSFSYQVSDYTIDKNGILSGPDNLDLEDALHQAGFDAAEREYDEPDTYESGLGGMGAVDEIFDNAQHKHESYDDIGLVIEMPRSSFTDAAIENLKRLVESKASLIKKALGIDSLSITVGNDKISFPWFEHYPAPEEISAYSNFIGRLCVTAKTLNRVTAQDKDAENEKYAFRCFLLRLGCIGDEYKVARKILLRNLSGSGAFRSGNPKVQELGERIKADAALYDDVMSLQDKEVDDNE